MRMLARLWLLIILALRSLQESPIRDVVEEDDVKQPKHYPPKREGGTQTRRSSAR